MHLVRRFAGADPPRAARVDRTVEAPRLCRRAFHQPGHVVIAADDAIERDDIGVGDLFGFGHEIAVDKIHAPRMATPGRLLSRRGEVRRRRIDVGCRRNGSFEQLVMNRSHTAADIEERAMIQARVDN